ncbi:S-layer homology domain-containing protein [Paenibacillus glycanilyticus]|uniref:S-layer homology domain-containing protein n=1 Tax=Paenibacillus glycanilyticus TaxID=126569 RepID=UPI000FDA735B|nr:S-layer homology domain-containing protein [Paenibacillus glycanilyticus]
MLSRMITGLLAVLMLFVCFPICGAYAADSPSFTITADTTTPQAGGEVVVTVHGDYLQALYGYEINLSYSSKKWQFVSAASALEGGFAVPPIVKDGTLTFAYTKTGSTTEGVSGSFNLATIKFKSMEAGSSDIKLTRIKTVDKNLKANEYTPNATVSIQPSSLSFMDVPEGFWAKSAIERAASMGIVTGYPDGSFKPNLAVTRAEFVAMLVRALKGNAGAVQSELNFADNGSIGVWAKPYIATAAAEGWVTGFNDGTFRPDQPITRTEMTVIATRVLKLKTNESGAIPFKDTESIQAWAKPYIAAAVQAGIIQGQGNNRFAPDASTSRAEAVTLILRMADYGQK